MSLLISDEIQTLNDEFQWLLDEVNSIIEQIYNIIIECSRRFPLHINGVESAIKSEKYQLISINNSMNDQIKVSCTLCADNITHADINIRLHKHPQMNHRTIVQNDCQWKLHQILDASNHLRSALNILDMPSLRLDEKTNKKFNFKTAEDVIGVAYQQYNHLFGSGSQEFDNTEKKKHRRATKKFEYEIIATAITE
ncbi:hypothetical protein SSS_03250 [Sarcoptes scabiei]|nr:hypothetical protein SSS_03250 [Sarcoptes scabiei]